MTVATHPAQSGRAAAIARRQALSAGKAALPPAAERVRTGERSAALPAATPTVTPAPLAQAAARPATPANPAVVPAPIPCSSGSCREQARARRAALSLRGRGDAPAAPPARAPRQGKLNYAPKVIASTTHARQTVTGLRIGRGGVMTGDEAGATLPVSGTQYIGADAGAPVRSGGPKVGIATTPNGQRVSGTLVRSKVAITGDEAGHAVRITGEVDPLPGDDLTERDPAGGYTAAQFQRQVDPHGHSVFGTNIGRSAGAPGSRSRTRELVIESTEHGQRITGSAIGRSARVTGDAAGACHAITGDQYLTPARAQAECGASGGGTAAALPGGAARRDPVTGAKVTLATTWGQQRVSGIDVEYNPAVSGDAPGSCAVITGTPYQGPHTVVGWCDPATGEAGAGRLVRRPAVSAVTGDAPLHGSGVTGTERGAARDITGTPYFRESPAEAPPANAVAALDARFSVRSPQRAAHLRAPAPAADAAGAAARMTGSFAIGQGKITGNLEFQFRGRDARSADAKPAHLRLTGEGRSAGKAITGSAWSDQGNVTGTEGATASERNPSERAGKPQGFAGAQRFKALAHQDERKQLVTGMFGWSSNSAAKVTLSGGAQG
jgi:hypothetical protein